MLVVVYIVVHVLFLEGTILAVLCPSHHAHRIDAWLVLLKIFKSKNERLISPLNIVLSALKLRDNNTCIL